VGEAAKSRTIDLQLAVDRIESQLSIPDDRAIPPLLIVLVGLPGTGKSTLARALAQALPAAVVESDFVRKQLFDSPAHSGQESQLVHSVCHDVIRRLLRRGVSTVSDATNLIESQREFLYHLADQCDARLLVVRVAASEPVIRQRLEQRQVARSPHDWSDADWSVYLRMQQRQDAIGRPFVTVKMDGDVAEAIGKVLRAARQLRR